MRVPGLPFPPLFSWFGDLFLFECLVQLWGINPGQSLIGPQIWAGATNSYWAASGQECRSTFGPMWPPEPYSTTLANSHPGSRCFLHPAHSLHLRPLLLLTGHPEVMFLVLQAGWQGVVCEEVFFWLLINSYIHYSLSLLQEAAVHLSLLKGGHFHFRPSSQTTQLDHQHIHLIFFPHSILPSSFSPLL